MTSTLSPQLAGKTENVDRVAQTSADVGGEPPVSSRQRGLKPEASGPQSMPDLNRGRWAPKTRQRIPRGVISASGVL